MTRADVELAELAGGFIHDLKNALGTVSLNLQLLLEDLADPQSPRERRALERAGRLESECQRLANLSEDFLRYARVTELDRKETDLAGVLDELLDFYSPLARSQGVEITSYVPADLPPVLLDVHLFKQALLNLLLNAQQAMPGGGEVTVQGTRQGGEVVLTFIDTGKGMSADVLAKAFKPFYTTRPGGTGLGLPMTRKIVEAHDGTIAADSEPGKGTRFTLRLPALAPAKAVAPPILCFLDGVKMPLSEAKVSVLDRGFVFGDGIYEVLRYYDGRPWLEDDHFARFARSLAEVRIAGADLGRMRRQMHELLATGTYRDGIVYLQVTRGVAPRSHAFPTGVRPTELLWVQETGDGYAAYREKGVKVSLQPDLRWKRCDVKSVNLLGNVLANQAAKEAGAAEAILYLEDGTMSEASHSAFFGVLDGVVRTTPLNPGILPSVTRKFTVELIREAGLVLDERSLRRDDLARVSELFLGGTSLEICPVIEADGLPVGDGKPGPLTRRLQAAYREAVARFLG